MNRSGGKVSSLARSTSRELSRAHHSTSTPHPFLKLTAFECLPPQSLVRNYMPAHQQVKDGEWDISKIAAK